MLDRQFEGLTLARTDFGVVTVTLDRPDRLNAMDQPVFDALPDVFGALAADDDVKAVVLTGAGRAFCAGADLTGAGGLETFEEAQAWMRAAQRGPSALHALPQPTVAAINGPVAGAGLGLALLCDIRFAAPEATFSAPFVRMGILPDFGTTQLVASQGGDAFAHDLLMTGRRATADEALRVGLVSRIADDVLAEATAVAEQLAALPLGGARAVKAAMREARRLPLADVLSALEPDGQAAAVTAPGFKEAAAAWLASRGA